MSQPYNIGNLKAYDVMPRGSVRVPESAVMKGRPRQSQPPMYTLDHDLTVDTAKSAKDFGLLNSPYQNKLYKPFDTVSQQGPRQHATAHTLHQSNDGHRQPAQSIFSEKDEVLMGKLQQRNSPKVDVGQMNPRYVVGSNRTMTLAGSGNKIDKQAYLNKAEPIRTSGGNSQLNLKKPSVQSSLYDNNIIPFSAKVLSDAPDNPFNKPATQSSPLRKAPRMSQPVFQQGFEDDVLTTVSTATGSPSQYSQPPRIDTRYQPRTNDEARHQMKTQPAELGYEGDLFKKQKDYRQPGAGTANYNTLQSFRSNMRKSQFHIADFIKGKELGTGKFGRVEIVKHKKTGFVCAMKTVPKSLIIEQKIIGQFIRQLKIQSCLDHPNITKLYGFFDDKENIYLLLELGSEGQLYQVIKKKKRLSESTTAYIMKQICEALKYLHGLNVLHRDIKPENIVITYNVIKLCDFGWAVNKGTELRSTFCGTPLYVSPEILKGQSYDEKIDVWSVGILTYQLLVGDIPFEISSEQELIKIIKEDINFPKDLVISQEAKDFVLKILKKNPDERLKIQRLLEHPFLQRSVDASELDL